jgi:hypothetical protein
LNRDKVSGVLEDLRAYEKLLNLEGVPFTEQKLPGVPDLDDIERRLLTAAGGAPEDLIAWFHWQGGLIPGPGWGRATVYGAFDCVGLNSSVEHISQFRWTPYGYPASTGPNPWVLLAEQTANGALLISNVFSGEIHTVFTGAGESVYMAGSISDMIQLWTSLWAIAFKWDPEMGIGLKIPGDEVPKELQARTGYTM